jgi:L-cysteine desulfidase
MYNKPIGIIANGVFPMNKLQYDTYIKILEKELIPALGCTEPIALAYAAAKVKEYLGEMPDKVNVKCSGNIIKNVKGVAVPNSGGLKGIEVSIILGILGGDASKGLEVLESITDENREEAKKLLKTDFCTLVNGQSAS